MILDSLNNSELYNALHPHFPEAFEYLKNNDFENMSPGKYEIKGDRLFALVSTHESYPVNDKLEAHGRYIDIQYLHKGCDEIGWRGGQTCKEPIGNFNESKDVILYRDKPDFVLNVEAGNFVIFYPHDAHAPLMGKNKLIKVVIKVEI